jgi:hypothetical protein
MNAIKCFCTYSLLGCLALLSLAPRGLAQQNSDALKATAEQAPADQERDGQHDFDGLLGSWKFHLKKLTNPLTGSTTWVEFEGTGVCFKIWDGRANMDTVELDSPGVHIEGLTVRLYDPKSHQWRLYWANSRIGIMDPPQVGQFKNGRGEFFAQDTINGKTILIRFAWTNLNTDMPHFEQAFSNDGGKTWEVNWITDQTRVPDAGGPKAGMPDASLKDASGNAR